LTPAGSEASPLTAEPPLPTSPPPAGDASPNVSAVELDRRGTPKGMPGPRPFRKALATTCGIVVAFVLVAVGFFALKSWLESEQWREHFPPGTNARVLLPAGEVRDGIVEIPGVGAVISQAVELSPGNRVFRVAYWDERYRSTKVPLERPFEDVKKGVLDGTS